MLFICYYPDYQKDEIALNTILNCLIDKLRRSFENKPLPEPKRRQTIRNAGICDSDKSDRTAKNRPLNQDIFLIASR